MTSPLVSATLSYSAGRVTFQGASGLKMPFSGAVVVPRAGGEQPDLDTMSAQESLFLPFWFPNAAPGGDRLFTGLRAMNGKRLGLPGPLIVLVAEDPGAFADFDFGAIFSEASVLTPQFPKTGTLTSSRPKYLVLQLDGAVQPADAKPKIAKEGQDLSTVVAGLPANFSGTLLAFDFAGMEIEADAALTVLGETNVADTPGDSNAVRVQFVDVLGTPLDTDDLFGLKFKPAPSGEEADRKLYKLQFPDAGRSLEIRLTDPIPSTVNDEQKYLWRNMKVAVWPGREATLEKVTDSKPDFDLKDGATGSSPAFLRLCVFHPSQTMQNEFGGHLDEDARFTGDKGTTPANGFALCSEADEVTLFNNGESYMRDVYEAINATQPGDKIYINNWSSSAHVHMLGTLSRMDLGPVDLEKSAVDSALQSIEQNRILLHVGTDGKQFLNLPDQLDRGEELNANFQYEIRRVPSAGVADKASASGFIRAGGTLGFPLSGDNHVPFPSRMIGRWKDLSGEVKSTEHTLATGINAVPPRDPSAQPDPSAPAGLTPTSLALGITADDPPIGTVIRKLDLATLRTNLDQSSAPLWLLVVNATTGRHAIHDLTAEPNNANLVLGLLPEDSSAQDSLYGVVLTANPSGQDAVSNLVVSVAVALKYSNDQHLIGEVPLASEELGALLRRAISNDVEVRAIYWENFLANIGGGDGLASGHTNNEEITALINGERNGKRGWAVRDRATRAFGSFHQKGIVLMRGTPPEAIAWLGGIDLAGGRWDTELHLAIDPDRQGGKWWDAQIRITGPAAVDVLRNFSQRWRALGEFITDPNRFSSCIPVAPTPAIQADTANIIAPPGDAALSRSSPPAANVQIIRTCPPKSCHGEIPKAASFGQSIGPLGEIASEGELGSLAAFLKAIDMAKRFLLINDQYFFSPEIALALHKALSKPDGPSGLILMLPRDLGEDPRIDPMLFKVREKSLQVLLYGGQYTPPPVTGGGNLPEIRRPHGGHITANASNSDSGVPAKTALLFARNRDAEKVYVHSKTMIVDDVWMIVGSANLNYRSSTYDFELNAGVVGDKLDFGGTDVVRQQRIELARLMLGLPPAYAPMIANPEVMFRHFKALESKDDNPSHSLHPLPPMSQKLKPDYVKKVGDAAFDGNVDIVSALDMNAPLVNSIAATIIDPDGRSDKEALAPFAGIFGNSTRAYARLAITVMCQNLVSGLINAGNSVFAEVLVSEGGGAARRIHLIPLELAGANVVISPSVGEIYAPLSTGQVTLIEAQVVNNQDDQQGCSGSKTVDPIQVAVLTGSVLDVAIQLN